MNSLLNAGQIRNNYRIYIKTFLFHLETYKFKGNADKQFFI
jgi:hypothetical protein